MIKRSKQTSRNKRVFKNKILKKHRHLFSVKKEKKREDYELREFDIKKFVESSNKARYLISNFVSFCVNSPDHIVNAFFSEDDDIWLKTIIEFADTIIQENPDIELEIIVLMYRYLEPFELVDYEHKNRYQFHKSISFYFRKKLSHYYGNFTRFLVLELRSYNSNGIYLLQYGANSVSRRHGYETYFEHKLLGFGFDKALLKSFRSFKSYKHLYICAILLITYGKNRNHLKITLWKKLLKIGLPPNIILTQDPKSNPNIMDAYYYETWEIRIQTCFEELVSYAIEKYYKKHDMMSLLKLLHKRVRKNQYVL